MGGVRLSSPLRNHQTMGSDPNQHATGKKKQHPMRELLDSVGITIIPHQPKPNMSMKVVPDPKRSDILKVTYMVVERKINGQHAHFKGPK